MSERRKVHIDLLRWLGATSLLPHRARPFLFRLAGVDVGSNVTMMANIVISGYAQIRIGDRAFLNHGVYIDARAGIVIEEDVQVADHVRIVTSSHEISGGGRAAGAMTALPVTIGRGSWLGSGVCVMPGLRVGERAIVGAGALVTKDLEGGAIYAGVPARRLRAIPQDGSLLG